MYTYFEFFVTEEADLKLTMEDFTRHKISWAVKIRQLLVCIQQMKDLKPGLVDSMYDERFTKKDVFL